MPPVPPPESFIGGGGLVATRMAELGVPALLVTGSLVQSVPG